MAVRPAPSGPLVSAVLGSVFLERASHTVVDGNLHAHAVARLGGDQAVATGPRPNCTGWLG